MRLSEALVLTYTGSSTGGTARAQNGSVPSTSNIADISSAEDVPQLAPIRSMLLCGADMAESMTVPGVWRPEHVHQILNEHGLVCIERQVLLARHHCCEQLR